MHVVLNPSIFDDSKSKMIKKLHWLFIKSFVGPFIGTFFIALFLLLMQTIWKYLEDLVGKGLELSVILEFIFYFAIHLIPMALPLAILLSSIMVFGNLAEQSELTAIKSAGVSLITAMRPMFVICFILSIAAFYTANNLIPKANLSWGALLYDVTKKKPAMNIVANVFFKDIEGYAIRVGKKNEDGSIEDIIIYVDDTKGKGNNNILLAKRGNMSVSEDQQVMTLYLEDGKRYQEMINDPDYRKTKPHNTMAFESYNLTIDLSELAFNRTEKERFSEDQRMMNVEQLALRIDSLERLLIKKRDKLYKYSQPYFFATRGADSVTRDNVQLRFDNLVALSEPKQEIDTTIKLSIDTANANTLTSKLPGLRTISKKINDNKPEVSRREDAIQKAIQNTNNLKRISENNISDASSIKELKAKYNVEWHRKYTLAISCILLFFIGAPLGAIIKKGGFGLPLVISLLLFILYYVLGIFGEKMVKQGAVNPILGMWFALMVFFPMAIFLTYKASRDSQLFDAEAYKRIIKLFTPKKYQNK